MDGKFVLVHAEFPGKPDKRLHGKGIVLHGDAEFLFKSFPLYIPRFHKTVLFQNLSCIAQELFPLSRKFNPPVGTAEQGKAYLPLQLPDGIGEAGL